MSSCEALKTLIKDQLSGDIGAIVGFLEGANLVQMRNQKDLEEAWDILKGNSKITLWCDGLVVERSGKRRRKQSPDDADEVSTKTKRRNEKIKLRRFMTNLNRHIQVILQLCHYVYGQKWSTVDCIYG